MTSFEDTQIGRSLSVGSSDEALGEALRLTMKEGHVVDIGGDPSVEILGLSIRLENPRDRLLANPEQPIGLVSSVARFSWMMGGNERLEDIALYQPRVREYTDDQLIVPGSNYGKRLFAPRANLNQIEGVIGRLRGLQDAEHPGSSVRRASAVIWQPEDAVRASNDIPCAFGLMYVVRDGTLIARTIMRSNNATTLLHVNLFEFGLLAEIVATEVGVALGPLLHDAFSFHIYEGLRERSQRVVKGWDAIKANARAPMPNMPSEPSPLAQTRILARLETELMHDLDAVRAASLDDLLRLGTLELNSYWLGFYRVLLVHALCRTQRWNMARRLADELPGYFRVDAQSHIAREAEQPSSAVGQLFTDLPDQPQVLPDDPIAKLRALCREIMSETDLPVTLPEYEALEERFVTGVIARRAEGEQFDRVEVEGALRELRGG